MKILIHKISEYFARLKFSSVILWFFIVAFLVYSNTLFNQFVEDDLLYIINDPATHIINIAFWFGTNSFNIAGQYRAIPAAYFSLLYNIFGTTPFFYHLLQVILHIASATLLYLLFRKFLSVGVSFFLVLFFLVHPIQVESVVYIAQTVSPMFFLFGITGLIIATKKVLSVKDLFFVFLSLLLSLMTKETGILFLCLVLVYSYLYTRNNLLKLSVGGGITLLVYAFFRLVIGHVGLATRMLVPIASLSLPERLINIPAIVFYYIKTFFLPTTLLFDQQWIITSINFSTFYFPLIIDITFFLLLILAGIYVVKPRRLNIKPYLFFFVWVVLGFAMHIQIFPLDKTVADRWFYFTLAGLLGLLGVLYIDARHRWSQLDTYAFPTLAIILILLSLRTIVRNTDWQNPLTLYTHDITQSDNYDIENSLGVEYKSLKQYNLALSHIQKSVALRPNEYNLHNEGVVYEDMGNLTLAKDDYEKALQAKDYNLFLPHKHEVTTYKSYASMLVFFGDPRVAVAFTQNAIQDYPDNSDLWFFLALAKYKNHDQNGALEAATKAYQLSPSQQDAFIYVNIQNNQQFSINNYNKTFIFKPT